MPYKLSDQEFREALREVSIEHEQADNPEEKLPPDYKPFNPLWYDHSVQPSVIDRQETLQHGPYGFLTEEQRAQLLEEVK